MSLFLGTDEEQFTIKDLANKMKEYLHDNVSSAYGNQFFKSKLLTYYGYSLIMAEGGRLHDILNFQEKTSTILLDYFLMPNMRQKVKSEQ